MPRVAPVTTTARPAMDVNMLAFPFPAAPEGWPCLPRTRAALSRAG